MPASGNRDFNQYGVNYRFKVGIILGGNTSFFEMQPPFRLVCTYLDSQIVTEFDFFLLFRGVDLEISYKTK